MMLTAAEFEERVGRKPEQDDLERTNCELAGQMGHYGCGLCAHGLPVFMCHGCFSKRCNPIYPRLAPQPSPDSPTKEK